jgi:hypothetical protein
MLSCMRGWMMLYENALSGRSSSSLSMHHVKDTRDGDEPCHLTTVDVEVKRL